MAIKRSLHPQPFERAVTQSMLAAYIPAYRVTNLFLISAAPTPTPTPPTPTRPLRQGRKRLFRTSLRHSDALSSSVKVEPGVAAATPSGGSTPSHVAAGASPSPSSSSSQGTTPKTAAVSPSGSNASPSQSPSVKANSAARDGSSTVIEMVVGLLSVAVFLVV